MKNYNPVIRFLMYAVGLSIGWFIIYDLWLTHLDELLTGLVIYSSAWALSLAGYNAGIEGYRITIDGFNTVLVYHACNGMVLMALFTGFILAFPGPVVKKLFYIPLGILIIHLINVLRVAALALNAHYSHQTLTFNHKYTFTFVVYSVIFALWMLWVKKFSSLKNYVPTASAS